MSQVRQVTEAEVREALQTVYDPELGLDIVSLGLVYDIQIRQDTVYILMTLTTPGCPMHDAIGVGAEWALKQLPGINHVEIELTWNPPWDPSRMSKAARVALGFDR
jgi:metal-sulfur cluster biosynthetic enzyme